MTSAVEYEPLSEFTYITAHYAILARLGESEDILRRCMN